MTANRQNWAGNYTFQAAHVHYPETIAQLQALVRQSAKVKVFGSRHSFNHIADTSEDHISLERLDQSVSIDRDRRTATITPSISYGQLSPLLHQAGFALHNMASLPHITVAGACATATHGSGNGNANLATCVTALDVVTANGDIVTFTREQPEFLGAVVHLGGLGVVISMTLDLQPAFAMQQEVYENLPIAQFISHFEAIESHAYSVSLFTDWQNDLVSQVWLKRKLDSDNGIEVASSFYGATLAPSHRHPITSLSADPCTLQMGIAGPWYERLPHFRVDQVPSSGAELQTEYFVPRQHAVAAYQAISRLNAQIKPHLLISEVRTIAADTLWMSPNYQQDSVGLHFTWQRNWPEVQKLLPQIEEQLAPFNPRPHWGKLFTLSAAYVRSCYSKLTDFQALLHTYDPQGKFRNAFLDSYIFGTV